jgi:hypothetical protein
MPDQPDPRLAVLGIHGFRRAVELLSELDSADRAAGIRRVTGEFTRQLQWAAWDDGYEAARNGQQKHNPHRPKNGSVR